MAVSLTSITVSVLPFYLFGAMASFIRDDLGFGHAAMGATAAGFYCTAALASIPAGHAGQLLGPERSMAVGAAISIFSLLGVAIFADSWQGIALLLGVGGVGSAVAQPGANAIVARDQPAHFQGTSFGLLQTAIPLSTLLAGFAVPAVAGYMSWRWGFALGAILAVPVVAFAMPRRARATVNVIRQKNPISSAERLPLYILAAAGGCAAAAGNVLGTFYVESIVHRGYPVTTAGVLLILGSVCGISGRLFWGWLADRRTHDPLKSVVVLLMAGILGFLMVGLTSTFPALLVGTLLAFGAGWAWKGLYNLAVVRGNADSVILSLGISQMGLFAGSVAGPFGFGILLQHTSWAMAWTATAFALGTAAALVYAVKWMNPRQAQL